ncbi:SAF domain-containing protein [Micromonospora sp. DT4]|uniref:SAF domain-containing protein n=1 Tax=Micromonospora sp. DT4 TaxID=3393438 RepID=UPI003CF1F2CE
MSMKTRAGETSGGPAPAAAPSRLRGRRVSRAAVSLSIVLIVVAGLSVVGLVLWARGGTSYLALARPVAYGSPIQAGDLTTVTMPADAALNPIPASEKDAVVGKFANVPLAARSLLTRDQIASGAIPGAGKQVVSVTLKSDQAPAYPLQSGVPVMLVRRLDVSAADNVAPMSPVPGTVRTVRDLEYGGGVVVDVIVSANDGPGIAAAAADNKVALLVTAGS